MKKKDYETFKNDFMILLQAAMGEEFSLALCQVTKVNVGKLDTVHICKTSENETQKLNFYLQSLYAEYTDGKRLGDLVEEVKKLYLVKSRHPENVSCDGLGLYENVRKRILFRVINTERNEEFLSQIPHRNVVDLSIFYCILMIEGDGEIGTVRVDNQMMQRWGVSEETLFEDAKINMAKKMPVSCKSLFGLVEHLMKKDSCFNEIDWENVRNNGEPVVLTNSQGINGFGSVFYDGVLDKIARRMGADRLYIIPSSLHESLIFSDIHSSYSVRELKEMVTEVNRACVSEEDFLSDSVYVYQVDGKTFEIAKEEEAYV